MVLGSVLGRKRLRAGSWLTCWRVGSCCSWEVVLMEGKTEVRYRGWRTALRHSYARLQLS